MDIKLINYKFYSGKSIIYELNGNVKEYNENDDYIEFEGEYLNGKRNGKGKEYYYDGLLKFEGEYLNGKRNGKGKEYHHHYNSLNIIFEGEYRNNLRWNGKGYDNNNVVYELKNGNGFVKEYYSNGRLLFKGDYLNGKRNGKGKEYDLGALIFEGEYKNGLKWNGKGYDNNNNIVYELKNGKGYVKEYDCSGKIYFEGEYLNGKRNGKGKQYDWVGQLQFEGEYLNGLKNGKGKEYDYSNFIFKGEYLYNHKLRGKYYINRKLEYEGEFLYERKWNGKGYDKNGNIIYELINGNGNVKEYEGNNLKFEGEHLNGKKNGKGKEYNWNGHLIFEGEYLNGFKNGKGKEYNKEDNLIFEGEYKKWIKMEWKRI